MTTAPETKFCLAELSHGGRRLWLDGNQKICGGNGTFDDPRPNALSLLPVTDCPGATPACREVCYVQGLREHRPDVYARYEENSTTIRKVVAGNLGPSWAAVLAGWINTHAPGGFRWHVSGDVISWQHAKWIRSVCRMSSGVTHWIYTRSFKLIGPLLGVPNLILNLSADVDNWDKAQRTALGSKPAPRLCYLATCDFVPPLPPGSVIFPDYPLRGCAEWLQSLPPAQRKMVCPVDFKDKSERRRCGPCSKCIEGVGS